jgi:hypothetical protein
MVPNEKQIISQMEKLLKFVYPQDKVSNADLVAWGNNVSNLLIIEPNINF